jgi:hypothetical protein
MFKINAEKCPRCERSLKNWEELTADEKFTVERLPMSADFSLKERKTHLFCPRCWFETKPLAINA